MDNILFQLITTKFRLCKASFSYLRTNFFILRVALFSHKLTINCPGKYFMPFNNRIYGPSWFKDLLSSCYLTTPTFQKIVEQLMKDQRETWATLLIVRDLHYCGKVSKSHTNKCDTEIYAANHYVIILG